MTATLLVIQGADLGTRFDLGDEPAGIGRGVHNAIRIVDTEVSRRHAVVECVNGIYRLTDRNSSNGTIVNGEPIRQVDLKSGDRIQVGRTVLAFREDVGPSTQMAAGMIDLILEQEIGDESQIVNQIDEPHDGSLVNSVGLTPSGQQIAANLRALYQISEEVVRPSVSIDEVLQRILKLTIDAIQADRGCILIADPDQNEIVPRVYARRRPDASTARMPVSRTIVDFVLRNGHAVRTSDAQRDRRFEQGKSIIQAGIREAMCVPMPGHADLMGVVYVDITTSPEKAIVSGSARERFTEEQLRWLLAVGRQAALAIEASRYQQALVQAERLAAMGQTIAMLSHHIKNILQGVRGGSYLIDMGLQKSDESLVRKGWGIVERNQGKIYDLVMDMLTYSKEREPAMELTQLNATIRDVCELMQARAEECGVTFEIQLDENLPESYFDPEGIHRAALNIITNAIDAVEDRSGGHVLVQSRFDADSDSLVLVISDNGPGIPGDQLSEIFSIFKSSKGARGTGIGLAVSRKIIHEHGGDISVKSEPGAGASFTLAWPRMDEDPRHGENATERVPVGKGPPQTQA